ncbi:MAG: hypothetical protein LC113_04575 [Acidobacteria bacterium]|nr:hypothetical protein [Acidobacteriota bacterium]
MSALFLLRRVANWWRGLPRPYTTIRCEEIEGEPFEHAFYVLGSVNEWALILLCPCGCGEEIQLNLLPEARPCWAISEHWDSTISVSPSVWRLEGCRSHFWIRKGSIDWVPDYQ